MYCEFSKSDSFKYISLELLWSVFATLSYGVSLLPCYFVASYFYYNIGKVACILLSLLYFYIFIFDLIIVAGIIHFITPKIETGNFGLRRGKHLIIWMIKGGIINLFRIPGLIRLIHSMPLLRMLYYRTMGAKIHSSVIIGYDVSIFEPSLVEISEGSKIGDYTKIACHMSDNKTFMINKVRIGKNVVIGADCGIGPGVTIGDGAVVGARSAIKPSTNIPSGEFWFGSPAKFHRKIDLNENMGG